MNWEPASEAEIWDMINAAERKMSVRQKRLWEVIRIAPQKWKQSPWGDLGGGFWVVGILGRLVVWFNDIEGGFNISRHSRYGIIDVYLCDQNELGEKIEQLLGLIEFGYELGPSAGPPRPGEFIRR